MEVLGPSVQKALQLRTNDGVWKKLLTEKVTKEVVILRIEKNGALTISAPEKPATETNR
jgi:hypothetical protein